MACSTQTRSIPVSIPEPKANFRLSQYLQPAAVLWLLLWANLNSGPWNLSDRGWPWGYLSAFRASLPLVIVLSAAALGFFFSANQKSTRRESLSYLKIYSLLGLVGALFSPLPSYALYFGLVQLLAIVICGRLVDEPGQKDGGRNWLVGTLVITVLYAAIVMYIGRGVIFGSSQTAYGIIAEIEEVAGMPMSRASGVARFAAVPAIVAFALFWRDTGWRRLLWLALFALFGFVIYRMHSRGGLFAAAGALAFLCLAAPRNRWLGVPLVLLAAGLLLQPSIQNNVSEYVLRGQDAEEFKSLTGRTGAWSDAYVAFKASPLLGSGNFADRLLINAHVHNAFLQALLIAGVVGFVPYLLSWIAAWRNLIRLWSARDSLSPRDQILFLVAGALLVFFTLRSIPETTTASFSVDLLVMLPVMAYLDLAPVLTAPIISKRSRPWKRQIHCGSV